MDTFDLKILSCLQQDGAMAVADLAERVGLSSTPVWRRVQKLEADGVIRRRVALLDRAQLNVGVTVFVAIRTNQHTAQWLQKFARAIAGFPEVVDCYRMSGDIDYLMRLVLPDIAAYDQFYKKLIARVELFDVTSMFAMEEIKSTTALPLHFAKVK